jgi:hypothetical protein
MSMRENPENGYVMEAIKLKPFLSKWQARRLAQSIEEGADADVWNLLLAHLPPNIPKPNCVFLCDDDFAGDDLQKGIMYVGFDEDDLFVKNETYGMFALKAKGVKPIHANWTVFS